MLLSQPIRCRCWHRAMRYDNMVCLHTISCSRCLLSILCNTDMYQKEGGCWQQMLLLHPRCCCRRCYPTLVAVKTSHHLCLWANKVVVILLSSHPVDCCLSWEGNMSWIRCARTRVVTSKGGLRRGHEVTSTTEGCDASSAASLCPCLRPGLVRRRHHQTVRQNNRFGRRERCVLFILCDIADVIDFSATAASSIPKQTKTYPINFEYLTLLFTISIHCLHLHRLRHCRLRLRHCHYRHQGIHHLNNLHHRHRLRHCHHRLRHCCRHRLRRFHWHRHGGRTEH